ncbi:DUF2530 domain-containing protein [Glaciibacter psychrotolerans]|uniref:DUF2530 domain-containing protein n=1 Tax=Glaciibacter psychrotolerans TaxID=670054 RepID=A0A7Z0EC30_9MICO|nr:DUF2530 domain-containing protein [Leifsonia psychrotolerans]NYJ18269.1 hypothetical protein [Leifsonia psychrotolerans]
MRLWLKDSERRPDPLPARTDARKAIVAGTAAWFLAAVAALILRSELDATGRAWWLWCALIGLGLGLLGFAWVQFRRR